MWKEAVMAYFKISQDLPGEIEENNKKPSVNIAGLLTNIRI
jgi:hypothetical protein